MTFKTWLQGLVPRTIEGDIPEAEQGSVLRFHYRSITSGLDIDGSYYIEHDTGLVGDRVWSALDYMENHNPLDLDDVGYCDEWLIVWDHGPVGHDGTRLLEVERIEDDVNARYGNDA